MNKESLNNITKLFKALNDKLARIEDPRLYAKKIDVKYENRVNILSDFINAQKNNQKEETKEKILIHDILEDHDKTLNDHADMIDALNTENIDNKIVPIETQSDQNIDNKIVPIETQSDEVSKVKPESEANKRELVKEPKSKVKVDSKSKQELQQKDQVQNTLKKHEKKLNEQANKISILEEKTNKFESTKENKEEENKKEQQNKKEQPKEQQKNDADAEKIKPESPTTEELKATNLRYNEKTQRFHENEGERKNLMVSKQEALNRVEEHRTKNAVAEPSQESNNILENIHANLIKINDSLTTVMSLLAEKPPKTEDAEPAKDISSQPKTDKSEKTGGGGLGSMIAFTLFAIFPAVKKFIDEKREKISEFFMPIFDFIFETVIPFFTEKLPKFFMEDVPKYFSEKFDVVKDFVSDFTGDIIKVIAGIKKTVGETIVSVAEKLPDWDFLKTSKDSLMKFGADMITSADATINEVDAEQAKTQAKRDEKKRMDILLKQADEEGKRVVAVNKAKGYKGYEVKPDFDKGLVTIEYKVDGMSKVNHIFDATKSMETGTLVEKAGGEPKPVEMDSGGILVKETNNKPLGGGIPESSTTSGASTGVSNAANPEINSGSTNTGSVLDASSKENETSSVSKSAVPSIVTIPSTGQKVRMLPGQGPHDINDVPDPTPFFDYMADQLFYRRA